MCDGDGGVRDVQEATPRPVTGEAVDPITLEAVDELTITTLVDNVFDSLLTGTKNVKRAPFGIGREAAPQFEDGDTAAGLRAEHGFSALVTVRRGSVTTSVLFDTGISPDGMVVNADRLGIDLTAVHAVVLSHGHWDHSGGLASLARRGDPRTIPMVLHPLVWSRRRIALPGREGRPIPTLSKRALAAEGFEVIERRQPSLLLDGSVLITGEVDRTTDFEHGMPPSHQAWNGADWEPDPLVLDDQALIVNVRDRGLVVLTGCGHAGAVNILRHASRLTGVSRIHALLGGLHLGGPHFEPIIEPTVKALVALAPDLLAPGHCTGWRAQQAFARELPEAWVPSSSGTAYRFAA